MILLLTILRLIPYVLTAVIAYQKGFVRLTFVAVLVMIVAVLSVTTHIPTGLQQVLNSIFAIALLFHAVDLKSRKGGES